MTQRPLGNDPGTSGTTGDPQTFSAWDPTAAGTDPAATSSGAFSATGSSDSGQYDSSTSTTGEGSDSGVKAAAETAKGEAKQVTETAVESGKQVAQTAKEGVANVAAETKQQAASIVSTLRSEVGQQVGTQQNRIADAIHGLSKELGSMASSSDESGPLTDLVHEASRRGGEIAHWLQDREPTDVLDAVRSYARRRPLTFLALCGLAGVVAGRLSRSAAATHTSLDSPDSGTSRPAALSSGSQYSVPTGTSYPTPASSYGTGADYGTGSGYGTGSTYSSGPGYETTGTSYSAGTTYGPGGTGYASDPAPGTFADPQPPLDAPSDGPAR